ncbi:MAG: PAS domain S-box protein [Desulfohalobiaceae bacterium]|nr:PAS domain S-box protein [Desulfohalobiaceae bacterium]
MGTDPNASTAPGQIQALERKIADLERREASRNKEQDFIREVLYWIDSLVVVIDTRGYIVNFNRASERLSGYSFAEVSRQPFWDILLLPEEREGVKSTIKEVAHRELPRYSHNAWVTKDGRIREISWKNSVLRDREGNIEYILCTGLDITEQKKAEASLRESEAKYRELVEHANSIIMRLDQAGNITFFNEYAQQFFGYSEKEIIGRNVIGTILPERDQAGDASSSLFANILEDPEQYSINENENRRKNGEPVWISWTNKAICTADGELIGILCIGNDITKRKELEDHLRQAQKMEAMGTLTGGIAHDFNNILGIILGYTEIAQHRLSTEDPLQTLLDEVKAASLRGRDVVSQLLSFSRKKEQKQRVIDIRPVIQESLKMLRSTLPATIEFQTSIPSQSFLVEGNSTQIHQILINLCTNAAHAMEENGGRLTVGLEQVSLSRKAIFFGTSLLPGEYTKLSVRDTGDGIEAHALQRIFDPYYTTKDVDKGTGMGLSIALGIVKAHGGGIRAESRIGEGTTFDVFLPSASEETQPESLQDKQSLPTGTERILFVDDERMLVDLNQARLQYLGYTVSSEVDPRQALQRFQSDPEGFELVITDMAMPGMTGDRLAREILRIRNDIPILLCTGFSERISRESAKAAGLAGYLEKPVEMHTLAATVREVLNTAQHRD